MSTLDRWKALSPYLDEVLELPEAERGAWLAALRERQPDVAGEIEALLDEQRALAGEQFLEGRPGPLPGRSPQAGDAVGAYTLVGPIGQGGMGTVWLAERADGRFERRAAVKFLSAALVGRGDARFRREGRILARLTHPHIAQLLDAGVTADGRPYLVIEHVDGRPIDEHCLARGLDVDARVRLFLDVASAVAHAHASLIVHRDLKPSNVLVRDEDGVVKLLDFGIAKLLEDGGELTALTREGGALTPEYAAPEQVTGDPITTATDVYSLGVLLFVLLTGRHPTSGETRTPAAVIKRIVDVEPRLASDAAAPADRPRLRGDVDTIVAKALKKAPSERYPSVTAFADDLRRHLRHEPVSARPDTLGYRLATFARRNRLAVSLAGAALVATGVGVAGTFYQASVARVERDFAFRQLARAEALNEFNTFVLTDVAPGGQTFTVDQLLAHAEHIARRQRGDPVDRVGMLVAIGRQYQLHDEDGRARAVLQEAYDESQSIDDASTRARASCALAASVSRDGQFQQGEQLYQDGLRQLPEAPRFIPDRIFCLARGSEVAREGGRSSEGVARADQAQRLVASAPFRSEVLAVRTMLDYAEALRMDGRQREAVAVFAQIAPRLATLGRDDTQTAGTWFNNWGLALDQLGRVRESEQVLGRAVAIGRDDRGEDTVSPMLLVNYGRALRDLGELDAAANYAERGWTKGKQAGDEIVVMQATMLRATIYRDRREFERAAKAFAEAEARLGRNLPPGHIGFASLHSERALLLLAQGNAAGALELAEKALAITEASIRAGGQGKDYLPALLTRQSGIELALGRAADAAADASRAVTIYESQLEPGKPSLFAGRAYLALGRALQSTGDRERAAAAFKSAIAHLDGSLGPDRPEAMAARAFAASLQAAHR